jgi:hypothetical protein
VDEDVKDSGVNAEIGLMIAEEAFSALKKVSSEMPRYAARHRSLDDYLLPHTLSPS